MTQNVVPSQMNLQIYKGKIKAAERGYDLLKKKNDSLKKKLQEIMKELIDRKKELKGEFNQAYLSIAEAEWSAGNFYAQVRDQVDKPSFVLDQRIDNIAGVHLPVFQVREADFTQEKIGRTQGAVQIENTRMKFTKLLKVIVELASFQTSFLRLDQVIRITSRRVNALEFIIIPKFKDILMYIIQELDEQEREDKYTAKKVLDNRRKAQALRDKEFHLKKNIAIASGQHVKEEDFKEKQESDNILKNEADDALF